MIKKRETNNAVIVSLENVRKHPNADRLKLATVLGTQAIVGLDANDEDIMVYFDSNLALTPAYLRSNNLYSNSEMNEDTAQKGYFGKNGRVRAQRLRGELSNGFVAELTSLPGHYENVCVGDELCEIDGVEVCIKYVPKTRKHGSSNSNKTKRHTPVSLMFHRHWNTKQLMRNLHNVPEKARLYIEEKIHGTSGRVGYVLFFRKWWQIWKSKQYWKVQSGTRRRDHTYAHLAAHRNEVERKVAPHLRKGEQLYFEIFGPEVQGADYSYGKAPGEVGVMLYRVTMTTVDDHCIDLSRKAVYHRAKELGLLAPPLLGEVWGVQEGRLADLVSGHSTMDANTLREGIVVWYEREDGTWTCLKHKNPEFLLTESAKDDGDVEDIL